MAHDSIRADDGSQYVTIKGGTLTGTPGLTDTQLRATPVVTSSVPATAKSFSVGMFITPAASAQDIATIFGSASATVYLTKISISGTQTTGGSPAFFIGKRSTVNTGGTSTNPTIPKSDSTSAAAAATVAQYSANPTAGTSVGVVAVGIVPIPAPASPTQTRNEFKFDRPIVLRGTTEGVALNLNGVTLTGGALYVTFEWYEV